MKSVLLIGLGRFGKQLAIQLNELGHDVMGIDHNEERVNEAIDIVTDAQIGDSTNEDFLRSLGVRSFDICYVTISNDFQSSLETTSLLKEMGAKFIVSRAERDGQEKFLLRNGADKVVYPEKQIARWAAIRYSSLQILDYIELDEKHSLYEVSVPESWIGKSVIQLDVRRKYDLSIIAVKKEGNMNFLVTPDTTLTEGSSLLILGEYKSIQKCFKI
ncbi:MAG: TrkA family potassium uptake protein [Ruminococcus sp.]|nr:TrkA family potassium uptake protein [Ruminococcus sp.]